MTMNELVAQALEAASSLTGQPATNPETQEAAFMLACAAMASEAAA